MSIRRRTAASVVAVLVACGSVVSGGAPAVAVGDTGVNAEPQEWVAAPRTVQALTQIPRLKPPQTPATRARTLPAGLSVAAGGRSGWSRAGSAGVWVDSDAPLTVKVWSPSQSAAVGVSGAVVTLTGVGADTAGVRIDPTAWSEAYGGGYAARLRLVRLPACADSTPQSPDCRQQSTVSDSVADTSTGTMTAPKQAPAAASRTTTSSTVVMALTAGASGSNGSFAATSLSPSGSWSAGGSSGAFTWSYPITVPPTASGTGAPRVALLYDSSQIDGRVADTNNQSSWLGTGWEYSPGFVERRYRPCANDPAGTAPAVYDLCWAGQVLSLSLNGRTTDIVRNDADGTYRLADDDGTKVELVSPGPATEYWMVTTPDGTRYWFGRQYAPGGTIDTNSRWTVPVYGAHAGEPCYSGSGFAASVCSQPWRWNLSYVEDLHGNAQVYSYTTESNYYGANNGATPVAYHRGGYLTSIEYGRRNVAGSVYGSAAPQRVRFEVSERCLPSGSITCDPSQFTAANASYWPDTPQDQACPSTGSCPNHAPTFWTTKRLTKIVTEVSNGTTYDPIDEYALTHTFPGQGDPQLWLASIQRTGKTGTAITLPTTTFAGQVMDNRVYGYNNQLAMAQWRLTSISTDTGATISVAYSFTDCTATSVPSLSDLSANTRRCFPVYWTLPYQSNPTLDFFHKYVVTSVTVSDSHAITPPQVSEYTYLGTPMWHFQADEITKAAYRSWAQWRGYQQVETRTGTLALNVTGVMDQQTLSRTTYLRGMHGDKTPTGTRTVNVANSLGELTTDLNQYAGAALETQIFNGSGGAQLSTSLTDPETKATTATRDRTALGLPPLLATVTATHQQRSRITKAAGGTPLQSGSIYDNDSYGRTIRVSVTADNAPASCTTTSYADNPTIGLLSLPASVITAATVCPALGVTPTPVVSRIDAYYDSATSLTTPPTKGDPTRIDRAVNPIGQTLSMAKTTAVFDASGRATSSTAYTSATDTTGRTSSTAYTPTLGGVLTTIAVTNPAGQVATTTVNTRGQTTRVVDVASHPTDIAYDGLGRTVAVRAPAQVGGPTPTVAYQYLVRTTGPLAVTTTRLVDTGTTTTTTSSVGLYDSLGNLRQTQAPADSGGQVIDDTFYDSHGWVVRANNHIYLAGTPATEIVNDPADTAIDSTTKLVYDGAGRPTTTTQYKSGAVTDTTTSVYGGDRTTVIPPAGATTTTTILDGHAHTTNLWQYTTAPTITGNVVTGGAHVDTSYTYTALGQLATILDPAGKTLTRTYDLGGRLTSTSDPDAGTSTSTYNNVDELLTVADTRGSASTRSYTYDTLGRRLTESIGSPAVLNADWQYDTLQPGTLTRSRSYQNGNAYTLAATGYDTSGRPTGTTLTLPSSETGTLSGASFTTSYTYTSTGAIRTQTLPAAGGLAAETITRSYSNIGNPATTISGLGSYVTASTYSPVGLPNKTTYGAPSGTAWTLNTYDPQTLRLLTQRTGTTSAAGVSAYSNVATTSYDRAGNVTKTTQDRADGTTPRTACYRYDALRELTAAWTATDSCAATPTPTSAPTVGGLDPINLSWTFTNGARTSQTAGVTPVTTTPTTTTYTRGYAGHAISSSTTTTGASNTTATYQYDPAGNTTQRALASGTQTLTWTPSNRVSSITTPAGSTSYHYTADGTQLIRRDPPSTTTVWLPDGTELTQTGTTTTATRYYTHGTATVATRTSTGLYRLVSSLDGTTTVAINSTTNTPTRRTLDPYGNPVGTTTNPPWPDTHSFLNKPQNPTTGLSDIGARTYDPLLGTFLSPDPLLAPTDPISLGSYLYANNNPTTKSDPSGLMSSLGGDGGEIRPPAWSQPNPVAAFLAEKLAAPVKEGLETAGRFFQESQKNPISSAANMQAGMTRFVTDSAIDLLDNTSQCRNNGICIGSVVKPFLDGLESSVGLDANSASHRVGGAAALVASLVLAAPEAGATRSIQTAARAAKEIEASAGSIPAAGAEAGPGSLFRGVHYGHPAYDDALEGTARPWGGHSDPARHNGGNNRSVFTSWTTDESIARDAASEGSGPGIVLRIPNADGPGFVRVPSPDVYGESEVLIQGAVQGAEILPWKPTP